MKFIKPSKKSITIIVLFLVILSCISIITVRVYPMMPKKVINIFEKVKKENPIQPEVKQKQEEINKDQADNIETERERLMKWLGLTEAEKKVIGRDHDSHADNLDPLARVSKITINEDGTKTYSSQKFGFEFSFPKEWNVIDERVRMNYYSKLALQIAKWNIDENGDNKFTYPVSINITTNVFADNFLKNYAKKTENVEIFGIKSVKYIACEEKECDIDNKWTYIGYIIPIGNLKMMLFTYKIDEDNFNKVVSTFKFTIPPKDNPMLNKEWDDEGDYKTHFKMIGGHGYMFKFYKTFFDSDYTGYSCQAKSVDNEKEAEVIKKELYSACDTNHPLVIRLVKKEQADAFIPERQAIVSEIDIDGIKAKRYIRNDDYGEIESTTIIPFKDFGDLYLIIKYSGRNDKYKKSMDKIISTFTFL